MRRLGLVLVALTVTCIAWPRATQVFTQEAYTSNPALVFEHLRVSIALSSPGTERYRALITLINRAESAYLEGSPEVTAGALDDIADTFIRELPDADACRTPLLLNVLATEALIADSLDLRQFAQKVPEVVRDRRCAGGTCSVPYPGAICAQGQYGCASHP